MGNSFFPGSDSSVGLSFISDAHSGFRVLGGFFVERASDLCHWQTIRPGPSISTVAKFRSGLGSTRMCLFDRAAANRIDYT